MASFWLLWGCLGEPKMRQSRFQKGVAKIINFRDPFFTILADFGCPRGPKSFCFLPLFWLVSDPGGYFFCSGAILAHFGGFWGFRNHLLMIFEEFLGITIRKRSCILLQKFYQNSPRVFQDSGRSRHDSEQLSAHLRAPGVKWSAAVLA